ncbi:TPA: acetyltransferase, partial [Escherichia coli]|nr:acetyltransferase [Escherichia coli]
GENVTILPGACIGNGVVIGANSVVRGEIPNNVIIAGVPAKIVKKYNYERMQWERI